MTTHKLNLEETLLDLAWSLWTELGAAGVKRSHRQVAIDPEMLLLLTGYLSHLDPRLRDESIDWCSRHHAFISTARLRGLFKQADLHLQQPFSEYASVVNELAGTRWPALPDTQTRSPQEPSGKSDPPSLKRPALIYLRMRALLGTGARADILTWLLGSSAPFLTAADLSERGYTKRNIANVLSDLASAGLLRATKVRNHLRFRWAKREPIETLASPLPKRMLRWRPFVNLGVELHLFFSRTEQKSDAVQGVESINLLPTLEEDLQKLGLESPNLGHDLRRAWDKLGRWAIGAVNNRMS